jgi:hypothetical protein
MVEIPLLTRRFRWDDDPTLIALIKKKCYQLCSLLRNPQTPLPPPPPLLLITEDSSRGRERPVRELLKSPLLPPPPAPSVIHDPLHLSPLVVSWRWGCAAGGCGVAGSQQMSTAVHVTWHEAQINFEDLPPYLSFAVQGAVPVVIKNFSGQKEGGVEKVLNRC